MKQYSAKYFYNKFEAIPEEKWKIGLLSSLSDVPDATCALGHLGSTSSRQSDQTEEAMALIDMFGGVLPNGRVRTSAVYDINDGTEGHSALGPTPRQRMLNALRSKMLEGAAIK